MDAKVTELISKVKETKDNEEKLAELGEEFINYELNAIDKIRNMKQDFLNFSLMFNNIVSEIFSLVAETNYVPQGTDTYIREVYEKYYDTLCKWETPPYSNESEGFKYWANTEVNKMICTNTTTQALLKVMDESIFMKQPEMMDDLVIKLCKKVISIGEIALENLKSRPNVSADVKALFTNPIAKSKEAMSRSEKRYEEKQRVEREKRYKEYWETHVEERKQLEEKKALWEKREIEKQNDIKACNDACIKEISLVDDELMNSIAPHNKEIEQLESQIQSLGLFKMAEKKQLRGEIEKIKTSIDDLKDNADKKKASIKQNYQSKKEILEKELMAVVEDKKAIIHQLEMER